MMMKAVTKVTKRWLDRDPPTIKQWLGIVNNIQSMEHLTFKFFNKKKRGWLSGKNGTHTVW